MLSWCGMAKNRKKSGKSKEDSKTNLKTDSKIDSKTDSEIDSKGDGVPQTAAMRSAVPKAVPPKPKTAAERRRAQIDGIKKTIYPAVLGVAGGFICFYSPDIIGQLPWLTPLISPNDLNLFPWHFVMLVFIGITYLIQKATYSFLGIDVSEFKQKDWFYVEFMAIDLWLVTWTFLLN
jgi:hypothetical protein